MHPRIALEQVFNDNTSCIQLILKLFNIYSSSIYAVENFYMNGVVMQNKNKNCPLWHCSINMDTRIRRHEDIGLIYHNVCHTFHHSYERNVNYAVVLFTLITCTRSRSSDFLQKLFLWGIETISYR